MINNRINYLFYFVDMLNVIIVILEATTEINCNRLVKLKIKH